MKQKLIRTCLIASCLMGMPAYAVEKADRVSDPSPGELRVKAIEVLGVPDGDQLMLTLTPGPAATKAIRVYSEPSHTLLAIVIDDRFASMPEGKAWLIEVGAVDTPAIQGEIWQWRSENFSTTKLVAWFPLAVAGYWLIVIADFCTPFFRNAYELMTRAA